MDWVWYSWGAYLHCFRPSWKSSKSDLKGAGASQATVFCFVFFLFFTSLSLVRKHHGKVLAKCGPRKGVISLQGGLWSGASFLVFLIKREREKKNVWERRIREKDLSELSCAMQLQISSYLGRTVFFWIKWDTMKLNCLLSKLDSGFLHTAGIDMRRVWRLLPWPGTLPTATT